MANDYGGLGQERAGTGWIGYFKKNYLKIFENVEWDGVTNTYDRPVISSGGNGREKEPGAGQFRPGI